MFSSARPFYPSECVSLIDFDFDFDFVASVATRAWRLRLSTSTIRARIWLWVRIRPWHSALHNLKAFSNPWKLQPLGWSVARHAEQHQIVGEHKEVKHDEHRLNPGEEDRILQVLDGSNPRILQMGGQGGWVDLSDPDLPCCMRWPSVRASVPPLFICSLNWAKATPQQPNTHSKCNWCVCARIWSSSARRRLPLRLRPECCFPLSFQSTST